MTGQPCPWCGAPVEPVMRGSRRKRFCSNSCRHSLQAACRAFAEAMLDLGVITPRHLRAWFDARQAPRAAQESAIPAPEGS